MNPAKTEIVLATYIDLYNETVKLRNSAEVTQQHCVGAGTALRVSAKQIEGLCAHVNEDLKKGTLDIPGAKACMRYLQRAMESSLSLAATNDAGQVMDAGRVDAYDKILDNLQKKIDKHRKDIKDFLAALERGDFVMEGGEPAHPGRPDARVPGVRPGMSEAAKRKAEEQSAPQEEAEVPVEAEVVEAAAPVLEGVGGLIPDYDKLSVMRIKKHLGELNKEELESVRRYESGNKARRGVFTAVDACLAALE